VAQAQLLNVENVSRTFGGLKAVSEVNAKLLSEARKNQCSFKTDSDELVPGCDKKLKSLANTLVEVKKRLKVAPPIVVPPRMKCASQSPTSGTRPACSAAITTDQVAV